MKLKTLLYKYSCGNVSLLWSTLRVEGRPVSITVSFTEKTKCHFLFPDLKLEGRADDRGSNLLPAEADDGLEVNASLRTSRCTVEGC